MGFDRTIEDYKHKEMLNQCKTIEAKKIEAIRHMMVMSVIKNEERNLYEIRL